LRVILIARIDNLGVNICEDFL